MKVDDIFKCEKLYIITNWDRDIVAIFPTHEEAGEFATREFARLQKEKYEHLCWPEELFQLHIIDTLYNK